MTDNKNDDQQVYETIEIDHPSFDEPIRLVKSDKEIVTPEGTYAPMLPPNSLFDTGTWVDMPDGTVTLIRSRFPLYSQRD
jgi:hypothetical protein